MTQKTRRGTGLWRGLWIGAALLVAASFLYSLTAPAPVQFRSIVKDSVVSPAMLGARVLADSPALLSGVAAATDLSVARVLESALAGSGLSGARISSVLSTYAGLMFSAATGENVTRTRSRVALFDGTAYVVCDVYEFRPTEAQIADMLRTGIARAASDADAYALCLSAYVALASERGKNAAEAAGEFASAWTEAAGEDGEAIEAYLAEKFGGLTWTVAKRNNRVHLQWIRLDWDGVASEILFESDGGTLSERRDRISYVKNGALTRIDNAYVFSRATFTGELVVQQTNRALEMPYALSLTGLVDTRAKSE